MISATSRPSSPPLTPVVSESSPISLLSAELLTLILDFTLTSAYSSDAFACGPDDDSVFLAARLTASLSSVCALWRAVVLGNPLWHDTISLVPPMWNRNLQKGLQRVKVQIERSSQVPLDLRIFGHADYTTCSAYNKRNRRSNDSSTSSQKMDQEAHETPKWKEYKPLFELLGPHLSRCRSLQLRGVFAKPTSSISFSFISKFLDTDMPLLETFIFEADLSHYDDLMSSPLSLFRSAPRLKQLRMVGVGISRFSLPSNAQSLTSLHLSRSSSSSSYDFTAFSSLSAVLSSCPALHTLAVYDEVLRSFPGYSSFFSCPVPSLEVVMILGNMLSVSELLLFLDAPNLKEVVIAPIVPSDLNLLMNVVQPGWDANDQNATPDAIVLPSDVRSKLKFPNLRTLTLAPAHPEAVDALTLASACFPFVEHLILANIYLSPFKMLFAGGLGAADLEDGLEVDGGGGSSEEFAEWDNECDRDSDDEGANDAHVRHAANGDSKLNADSAHDIDSDSDTGATTHNPANPVAGSNANDGERVARRRTLFPNMLTLSLTAVDGRYAQAIRDVQVLRGFGFEDAARASCGEQYQSYLKKQKRKKWRSKHSAARKRLLALTRGAGGACVPLHAVYLDTESHVRVGEAAYVWNEFGHDYDWLENSGQEDGEAEDMHKGKKKDELRDYDRYVLKADAWEARRRMALFAQTKDLYVGQPQDFDDY
ncbi:hypothetical protein JR316_0012342 [Psilocybe cubensis]|nr:hypothetical protein JR316_0012342 [Psilocybe cubensis]KAH9475231.1 hypothetical protein JR316_0012342 [Psilocybe cubensis]